jgi:hypothetical protein
MSIREKAFLMEGLFGFFVGEGRGISEDNGSRSLNNE